MSSPASYADLAGKTAIVTGSDSGIGNATALRLIEAGAQVVASDVHEGAGLKALAARGATIQLADVTSAADRAALVSTVADLDYLVNSAGVIKLQRIDDVTEADWDLILGVNAKATFFLIQVAAQRMRDGGAIVNLSSIGARRAVNVETAAYSASKAAVSSLTRTFAYAYASRDIRVNSVLPGLIDTPMQRKVVQDTAAARGQNAEELGAARGAEVPLGRLGNAEDVAETILWLLSSASGYLTGQQIAPDGGLTMY